MSDFPSFFDQIIDRLGGREAVQALLAVGPSALSNYRMRASLPARQQARLAAALKEAGWLLDLDQLRLTPLRARGPLRILLIITGGIAAYKGLELARRLMDRGYHVTGVMTESAQQFITPLSLAALTGEKVYSALFSLTDESEMGHIRLARQADLVLIAPATANFLAKMAAGLADDLASTLCLATDSPVVAAPAMNPVMWAHPATQHNLATLQQRAVHIIPPQQGDTACGEIGTGRLPDAADIISYVDRQFSCRESALSGRHILVTSGPTYEPVDSVRYIANHSSGKQGHALAMACLARGAQVTLVSGPVQLADPPGARVIRVKSAQQMHDACIDSLPADAALCAAAVADWHVVGSRAKKIKKGTDGPPQLTLAENPDILASLSRHASRPALVVGFAAETENLKIQAMEKRARKKCDWIVGNLVGGTDMAEVFGADENQVSLFTQDGVEDWPRMSKQAVADRLADRIEEWFDEQHRQSKTA